MKVANTTGWAATVLGDALAAGEPGAEQVEGVAPVGLGAAGADVGAAVAAGLVDHLVGQVVGADRAGDLAGRRVDVADGAAQQDGPGAGGGGPHVRQPGVVGVAADGEAGKVPLTGRGRRRWRGGWPSGGDEPAVAGAVERGGGGVEAAGRAAGRARRPGTCPRARVLCPGAGASIGMPVGVTGGSVDGGAVDGRDGRRGAAEVVEE